MTSPTRPPSMNDVARAVGVSYQTVSRVLNEPHLVKESTREKVEQAIRELGYRPNSVARALKTARTDLIGVIAPITGHFGPTKAVCALERAAREAGKAVVLVQVDPEVAGAPEDAWERLLRYGVDGAVVVSPCLSFVRALRPPVHMMPIAVAGGEGGDWPAYATDQRGAAYELVEHLVAHGAKRVAHVAGPLGWWDARERERGWREALADAGLPEGCLLRGDWSAESGEEAGKRLLAGEEFDAVFVANDQMALGVIRALADGGVSVPGDVLVAGFDDIPAAGVTVPRLTTAGQNFNAVADACIAAVSEGAASSPGLELLPAELIFRESSVGK
ncbi:LacI family DNA-binding transcriptional regulator [Dermabacteraceae bacterium P13088]